MLQLPAQERYQLGSETVVSRAFELQEGQSIFVEVEQLGIDVALQLQGADGILVKANAPGERTATERLHWVARRPGKYALVITPVNSGSSPGAVKARYLSALPTEAGRWAALGNRWLAGDPAPSCKKSAGNEDVDAARQAASCYELAADAAASERGRFLYQQADALRSAGALEEALPIYDLAIAQLQKSRDHEWEAAALQARGWSLSRLQRIAESESDFDRSLELLAQLRQSEPEAARLRYDFGDARNNRCIAEQRANRLSAATECFNRNLVWAEELAYPAFTSATLNGAGFTARARGDIDSAVTVLQQALARAKSANAHLETSTALNTLGVTWQSAGEFEKAVDSYRQALVIYESRGDDFRAGIALGNLGTLYRALGDLDRARDAQARSLEMFVELGDTTRIALANNNLGLIAFEQKDFESAVDLHQKALSVWISTANVQRQVRTRTHLIRDYLAMHAPQQANAHESEVKPLLDELQDVAARADFSLASAALALANGDAEAALTGYLYARSMFADTVNPLGQVSATLGLSRAYRYKGDFSKATSFATDAVERLEAARPRLLSLTTRASFSHSRHEIYQNVVDLLMIKGPSFDAEGALAMARRSKMATLRSIVPTSPPSAQATREHDRLARRVSVLHSRLLNSATSSDRRSAYFNALSALEDWERTQPRSEPTTPESSVTSEALANQLALTYFFGESSLYVWQQRQEEIRWRTIADRQKIEAEIRAVVTASQTPTRPGDTRRQALASKLLPERSFWSDVDTLSVSADGPLHLLSFAALGHDVDGQWRELVRDFDVVYGSGNARPTEERFAGSALIVADPSYGAPTDFEAIGLALPQLPGTRAEVSSIGQQLGDRQVRSLMGFEATRSNFLRAASPDYGLIHVATHGIYDDRVPAGSGLALSRVSPTGNPIEWFVNVHDVARLRLNAGLVTLSGCDTARGELINGEGLVGLTRAFLQAGAHRVMSSLWAVSDRATRALMTEFYAGYLGEGLSASAALAKAQRSMMQQRRWRDPYFWAGFAIIEH